MTKRVTNLIALSAIAGSLMIGAAMAEGKLNVYNWADYIGEETIAKFEAETGIDVTYDVYDTNEILEAKLQSGSSGYDVVVPTSDFLARGFEAGTYQPLDISRLSNFGNQDGEIHALASGTVGRNDAGTVYMWGTTGVAYNEAMIAERLGDDAPTDSWALIFEPEYVSKLQDCGVAILDAPTEILPLGIAYNGSDGASTDHDDFRKARELFGNIRPYIRYINSGQVINDMANGDICAATMWSGDAFQATARAEEADNGHIINYYIPKEGTNLWFDMFAIPVDAKNVENAYKFIDFMMRPDIAAENVNYIWYASGNTAANAHIDPEILEHPGIYPTAETKKNLYVIPAYDSKLDRLVTRLWTQFSTGG